MMQNEPLQYHVKEEKYADDQSLLVEVGQKGLVTFHSHQELTYKIKLPWCSQFAAQPEALVPSDQEEKK